MERFTVIVSANHAQHYLDGIPISDEEARIARRELGDPEHEEVLDEAGHGHYCQCEKCV